MANTRNKLALLASLYLSQGLPFGLFTQALPVWMREAGHSLGHIGLTNLLALPWALKFLWSPLIDRSPLPRRAFILPLQVAAIGLLAAIAALRPDSLAPILVAIVCTNLFAATQDIATDALAVDMLEPHQRGWGNGIQVAGYRAGMMIGGGALLVAFGRLGWSRTFLTAAAILAVATIPIAFTRNARRRIDPDNTKVSSPQLHVWFARPGARAWLTLLVVYKLGDALGTGMVRPFLVDKGLTLEDIGWLIGTVGSAMGLVGAVLGGVLVQRMGRRAALVTFASLQTATMVLYAIASVRGLEWAYVAIVTEHLFSGMATAALFTVMMDTCRIGSEGVDYTVQASVVVIAQGLAAVVSGYVADALGYPAYFGVSILLCAMAASVASRHKAPPPFTFA